MRDSRKWESGFLSRDPHNHMFGNTHLIQFLIEKKVKNVSGYRIVFSIEPDADKIYLLDLQRD